MKSCFVTYALIILLAFTGLTMPARAAEYTFGQWASDRGLPTDTASADAKEQGINSLTGLTDYTALVTLYLHYNQLSSIESGDFTGLSNLQKLWLNGNHLTSIESGDFTGLNNLQGLYLSYNQLSSIESGGFAGLSNLAYLSLVHNRLNSIESDDFAGLSKLTYLDLASNQLSSIESGDFTGLSNLKTLVLYRNQLSSIESGVFADMRNLQGLYLWNNPLTQLNLSGAQLRDLVYFTIDGTGITTVDLSDCELSQTAFNGLMNDGGKYNVGIAELAGIVGLDFSGADLSGVTAFSKMYAMADLEWLNITETIFSDDIIADDYGEVLGLVDALELNSLGELTIDNILYGSQQSYFNTWDAGIGNTLTVIPEPATLSLLAIGALAVVRRRRKNLC